MFEHEPIGRLLHCGGEKCGVHRLSLDAIQTRFTHVDPTESLKTSNIHHLLLVVLRQSLTRLVRAVTVVWVEIGLVALVWHDNWNARMRD